MCICSCIRHISEANQGGRNDKCLRLRKSAFIYLQNEIFVLNNHIAFVCPTRLPLVHKINTYSIFWKHLTLFNKTSHNYLRKLRSTKVIENLFLMSFKSPLTELVGFPVLDTWGLWVECLIGHPIAQHWASHYVGLGTLHLSICVACGSEQLCDKQKCGWIPVKKGGVFPLRRKSNLWEDAWVELACASTALPYMTLPFMYISYHC